MPAFDLAQGRQTLTRYDVVGQHAEDGTRFVTHVALHDADDFAVEADGDVSVVHMSPPLKQGEAIKAHVAGRVPLTNDEIKEISAWIKEIADEYDKTGVGARDQYVIDPPWKDEIDPNTGVRRYRKYSCVGFVLDGHLQVDIELLRIKKSSLPRINQKTIASGYPGAAENPEQLAEFGVEGPGPWRIVLAGYVLHALDCESEQIRRGPYQAQRGNEQF